ncbi:FHA domain-containing protein [Pyrus ussuriensis x Pyrus communis]|uniref:FHA domain-containing protein n=1 Tax=Pyrus ussuriensis x Pyrus communis TaxID=2448454 RepID=A0A5N5HHA7_9ROSA|nr:FHA domain-containing protein [Pyrus ussuriensis x Pyrus communis]
MEPSALKLVMVQGPRKGETLEFIPGSKVRIGRVVRGNNLPIKDSGISSKHLSIESESGKWVLRDLDSSNGTVLNGSNIPPNTPVDLTDGDEIKIGEYTSVEVKIAGYEETRLRRNPRRAAAAAEATAVPVSESRGRRGRVAKEGEEKAEVERANVEEIEVAGKRGRGRPPRARVLKSEAAEEKPAEENLARQVSTRQTRSSRIEELGKIPENSGVDSEGVNVEPKRTHVGARRTKNVPEEVSVCDQLDVKEEEASNGLNLEEERHEEADREFNVRGESGEKGKYGSGSGEKGEKGSGSGEIGVNGSGSGSGVNESCDSEKMTLGEWFDFLERNFPQQIIDETEEAIAEMAEKAKRIQEYIVQEKEKAKVLVGYKGGAGTCVF